MNEGRYREAEARLWQHYGLRPTERRLQLNRIGTAVRVQEVGEGPPVLLVHGASNTGTSWASLLKELDGFRCIALDRPGCGLSDPIPNRLDDMDALGAFAEALVVDVLDALSIESAPLIATSFGGYLGIRSTAAHPDRIERLFLFGWSFGAPTRHFPLIMRVATAPALGRLMLAMPISKGMVRAMFKQIGLKEALVAGHVPDELVECFHAMLRDTNTMRNEIRSLPRIMTLRGPNTDISLPAPLLGSITTPVNFLWGDGDPMGGGDEAREFASQFTNAQLDMMPGAGHAVWIDDPVRSAEAVTKFLTAG